MKAAIYARVSTSDQTCENQLLELRRYCAARGWPIWAEFIDNGVSQARRTAGPPWTNSWGTPDGAGSTSWSAGGWIGSAGVCVIS